MTCHLHSIDPHDYLVDVLQHVGRRPASQVEQFTRRLWRTMFACNLLRAFQYFLPHAVVILSPRYAARLSKPALGLKKASGVLSCQVDGSFAVPQNIAPHFTAAMMT